MTEPRISLLLGDITTQRVDAIVNAANSSLLGGGGVDGAIHRAAGPRLLGACRDLRRTGFSDGLPVGRAVATEGFDLPARWVIHTVGPNRHAGQTDPDLLRSCFTSSLNVAREISATSVAFPAISAGVYGWAADDVARVAWAAVTDWIRSDWTRSDGAAAHESGVTDIRFVLFSQALLEAFEAARP